jgi:hypothetical protein
MEVKKWQKRKRKRKQQRRKQPRRRKNDPLIISSDHKAVTAYAMTAFIFNMPADMTGANIGIMEGELP